MVICKAHHPDFTISLAAACVFHLFWKHLHSLSFYTGPDDGTCSMNLRSINGPFHCFRPRTVQKNKPNRIVPPYTAIDQFMLTAVTGVAGGKKENTVTMLV